jgi:TfoX/Sxy family transcriptional regulator of competence genes
MAKKERSSYPPETLALYDALIDSIPNFERKGAANPYTSVNGHMTSAIYKDGRLGIRLSKTDLAEFLEKYNTENPVAYGAVMKEYGLVPMDLLENTKELLPWFKKSYDYVSSLKPKPTTKKK